MFPIASGHYLTFLWRLYCIEILLILSFFFLLLGIQPQANFNSKHQVVQLQYGQFHTSVLWKQLSNRISSDYPGPIDGLMTQVYTIIWIYDAVSLGPKSSSHAGKVGHNKGAKMCP